LEQDLKRSARKIEHIKFALELQEEGDSGFGDVHLVHCALPEVHLREIDLSCEIFGKGLAAPIIINAITGGSLEVTGLNRSLARVAAQLNLGMAVGSQTAALRDKGLVKSYTVVREENPDGLILANIGCHLGPEEGMRAVEMIGADALQVHINVPQELAMPEGERDFRGWKDKLVTMVSALEVPVVAKEVGFGLSREVIRDLVGKGVKNFDLGGRGGTNFISIEEMRGGGGLPADWGITTLCSLMEAVDVGIPGLIIATGGVRSPLDAAKALALGAEAVGMAGPLLKVLIDQGEEGLRVCLEDFINQLKVILLLCGARNLRIMKQVPAVITGQSREWLEARGISVNKQAKSI